MANFQNTAAGRTAAENLVQSRMASKTWVNGHVAISKVGNTIVRFQRFMSPTNPGYGAWVESRDDDADGG